MEKFYNCCGNSPPPRPTPQLQPSCLDARFHIMVILAFNVERDDCTQSSENGSQAADPSPYPCPRTAVRTGRAVMSCFSQRESCRATAGISAVLLLCDFIFPSCKITALTYVRVVFPAVQVNVYKCRATISAACL